MFSKTNYEVEFDPAAIIDFNLQFHFGSKIKLNIIKEIETNNLKEMI